MLLPILQSGLFHLNVYRNEVQSHSYYEYLLQAEPYDQGMIQ